MALYTSYYTRQLALRPEAVRPVEEAEGERTVQKAVPRRTVDYAADYLNWAEDRPVVRCPSDLPPLPGTAAGSARLLPPLATPGVPVSGAAVKFAQQAPSKTRSSVNAVVWTPDGRRCLTGTQAGEFTMWGGQSFQFETIIQSHETPVRTMCFAHNGNFLLSGDDGGLVRYWKTNLELVKSGVAHREAVRALAFAPSDLKYATASDDSTVRVWDFARVACEQVLAGHGGDVKAVDWHPSKSLLVSGSKDGLVKLWCPRSGRCVGTMHGHKGTITHASWNRCNGNWVLTGARDQSCRVYDVRMQREAAAFVGQGRDVTCAAWHPVHEELFCSGGHEGSLTYWLVGRAAPQAEVRGAHEGSVWAAAWHPSGHLLTTGAADFAVKFWCRARPGDPFMDEQQEEQRELAAAARAEAAQPQAAAPRPQQARDLPLPGLFAPAGAAVHIPGIGQAAAVPVVTALPGDSFVAPPPSAMPPAAGPSGDGDRDGQWPHAERKRGREPGGDGGPPQRQRHGDRDRPRGGGDGGRGGRGGRGKGRDRARGRPFPEGRRW